MVTLFHILGSCRVPRGCAALPPMAFGLEDSPLTAQTARPSSGGCLGTIKTSDRATLLPARGATLSLLTRVWCPDASSPWARGGGSIWGAGEDVCGAGFTAVGCLPHDVP